MTANEVFVLLVEAVFAVVFFGALLDYARRRNPVSRDVAFTFSPFVGLLAMAIWRWAAGSPPTIIATLLGLLFLVQPVIALHLVAHIRPVPRSVQVGALVALIASLVPVVLVRPAPPVLGLLTLGVFTGIQFVAAGYLVVEARRRRGPGGQRLAIAALSTLGLATALLLMSGSALGGGAESPVLTVALGIALLSGVGYVVAFMPPTFLRRIWQAGATVRYQRELLARAGTPVEDIWAGFATLASEVTASACVVLEDDGVGTATVIAGACIDGAVTATDPTTYDAAPTGHRQDVPVAELATDDPIRRFADGVGARFVSVVDIGEAGTYRRSLIVAGSHRTLFHESDLSLLSAIGSRPDSSPIADRCSRSRRH